MIDFDDVLSDPELGAESLSGVRLAQTVNAHGRAINSETPFTFTGIVTQDQGAILERVAEASYVKGSIMVTTSYPLRMTGDAVEADVIVWNGARYTVAQLTAYIHHGVNWAVCVPEAVA